SGGSGTDTGGTGTGGGTSTTCASDAFFEPTSGLCWHVGTEPLTDYSANLAYCQSREGGLAGWRMPTLGELLAQMKGCPQLFEACGVCESCTECSCDAGSYSCSPGYSAGPCTEVAGPGPAGCYWGDLFGVNCTEDVGTGLILSSTPVEDDAEGEIGRASWRDRAE